MPSPLAALAALSLAASPLGADEPVHLSTEQVLQLMKFIPAKANPNVPGQYDRAADAREAASAIALVAPDAFNAALMSVFSAFESSNQKCVGGDKDKHGEYQSWGLFQLRYVPKTVACDPVQAAHRWLSLANEAQSRCAALPPDERLAALTSGDCGHGHVVSRSRMRLAREVLSAAGF